VEFVIDLEIRIDVNLDVKGLEVPRDSTSILRLTLDTVRCSTSMLELKVSLIVIQSSLPLELKYRVHPLDFHFKQIGFDTHKD
jgi:hypothetical protein